MLLYIYRKNCLWYYLNSSSVSPNTGPHRLAAPTLSPTGSFASKASTIVDQTETVPGNSVVPWQVVAGVATVAHQMVEEADPAGKT